MNTTDTTTTTRNGQNVTYPERLATALRSVLPDDVNVEVLQGWDEVSISRGNARVMVSPSARDRRAAVDQSAIMAALNRAASRLGRDIPHYREEFRAPAHELVGILRGAESRTEEPTFTVEMWTTDLYDGSIREIHTRSYPTTTRKHDAIRNLATYALATPEAGPYHVRVPRKYIRVNSAQGVAWDTRNVASAAYFRIVEA